ncbi:helix-turn-helix domain-containing protein [Subtercola vilae]
MWEQHIKQTDLAASLGLDQTAVSKKNRGSQSYSVKQLKVIAFKLDTSVAYLVGETNVISPTDPDAVGSSVASSHAALAQSVERFTRNE